MNNFQSMHKNRHFDSFDQYARFFLKIQEYHISNRKPSRRVIFSEEEIMTMCLIKEREQLKNFIRQNNVEIKQNKTTTKIQTLHKLSEKSTL